MKFHELHSSGSGRDVKRLRLPGPADDRSDVLLPIDSTIPHSPSVFPPRQLKWRDYTFPETVLSNSSDATSGVISPSGTDKILGVDQGPNQYQRNGNIIFVESIHLRGMLYQNGDPVALVVDQGTWAMLSLCLDTQTNFTQCGSQQIFSNWLGSRVVNTVPLRNMEFSSRFSVLKSELFDMSPRTLTLDAAAIPPEFSMGGRWQPVDFFVPVKRVVNFRFDTAGIASMVDLSAHLVGFCSGIEFDTHFSGHARIRFCDLS